MTGAIEDEAEVLHQDLPVSTLAWRAIRFSVPVAFAMMLQFGINLVSIATVGRIGPVELSAAALSTSLLNALPNSLIIGLGGALETILSQIYGRDQRDPRYGTVTLRMIFILLWALIPFAAIISYLDVLLQAIGMPADVSNATVTYSRIQIFGLPAFAILETLRRFLQCQNITFPLTVMQAIALGVHTVMQQFAVAYFGFEGSAWGWVVLMHLMVAGLLVYIRFHRWDHFEPTFPKLSPAAVRSWWPVLREGLSAYGMTVVEWTAFELSNICSGFLGTTDLAAYSIVLQCYTIAWSSCNGYFYGAAFYSGEFIGAREPLKGRKMACVFLALTALQLTFNNSIMVTFGSNIARIFTADEAVVARAQQVFYAAAAFHVGDAMQSCCIGISKGIGMQTRGAIIMFVTWLVVGFPLNYLLAFKLGVGAPGLYLGFFIATAVVSLPSFTYSLFLKRDWASLEPVDAAA